MVPALVVLLSLAVVVLVCGGVGDQECCVVVDEHRHEEAANHIDGEEKGIQCVDGWFPQEPYSWQEEPHQGPPVETS